MILLCFPRMKNEIQSESESGLESELISGLGSALGTGLGSIPSFHIRNIPIYGNMALSPMAGISDSPYRRLVREWGAAWSYTEFVAAEQVLIGKEKTFQSFRYHPIERPIWFQIFGNAVDPIVEAAKRIESLEPDAIDINMGCSTHKVSQRGSGAGLLRNLPLAGRIIESLRKKISVPITAKIRLGWDQNTRNYLEALHVLEESGVEALSVHGRTKDMGYSGEADWNSIAEIKARAKIPIIGNGDITDFNLAQRRIRESKVDAVLIGRSAISNPWIFSGRHRKELTIGVVTLVAQLHYQRMVEFYTREHAFRDFKKFFYKYYQDFDFYQEARGQIVRKENAEEFEEAWFQSLDPSEIPD